MSFKKNILLKIILRIILLFVIIFALFYDLTLSDINFPFLSTIIFVIFIIIRFFLKMLR